MSAEEPSSSTNATLIFEALPISWPPPYSYSAAAFAATMLLCLAVYAYFKHMQRVAHNDTRDERQRVASLLLEGALKAEKKREEEEAKAADEAEKAEDGEKSGGEEAQQTDPFKLAKDIEGGMDAEVSDELLSQCRQLLAKLVSRDLKTAMTKTEAKESEFADGSKLEKLIELEKSGRSMLGYRSSMLPGEEMKPVLAMQRKLQRNNRGHLMRMYYLVLPQIFTMGFTLFFTSLSSSLDSLNSSQESRITDIASSGDKEGTWQALQLFAAVTVAKHVVELLQQMLSGRFNRLFANGIKKRVFNSVMRQDMAYFDTNKSSVIQQRMTGDARKVVHAIRNYPTGIVSSLSSVASSVVVLLTLSTSLTKSCIYFLPFAVLLDMATDKYFEAYWRQRYSARGSGLDLREMFLNFRTVRTFAKEAELLETFSTENREKLAKELSRGILNTSVHSLLGIVFSATLMNSLLSGSSFVTDGSMTPAMLFTFSKVLNTLQYQLSWTLNFIPRATRAAAPAGRLHALLDEKPTMSLEEGKQPKRVHGTIALSDVHFAYPTRKEHTVLRGLSLVAPAGKMTALVGPSGSGKSTCISLLLRFYDPLQGTVTLDGVDLRELNPCWLRQNIAIVSQEPVLFSTSIRDNVCYGMQEEPDVVDLDRLEEAARMANALEFIEELPEGWRTVLGGSQSLSGGQKQRIAITRALMKNPKLLLLDEATSALDAESEHLVQEALDKLMRGRTTIVIAHRLSTIRNADKICVIETGVLAEEGTHDELLAKGGVYAALVKRQLSQVDGDGDEPAEETKGEEEDISDLHMELPADASTSQRLLRDCKQLRQQLTGKGKKRDLTALLAQLSKLTDAARFEETRLNDQRRRYAAGQPSVLGQQLLATSDVRMRAPRRRFRTASNVMVAAARLRRVVSAMH
eukprot:PLAT6471.1.p1 GENE.PLAT6471.1~~PLAT6471.1.p1  ORF type:complete len:914 (-),score=481.74 PLAT6471.1:85-2826(-)